LCRQHRTIVIIAIISKSSSSSSNISSISAESVAMESARRRQLFTACVRSDLPAVEKLLDTDPHLITATDAVRRSVTRV